MVEFQEKVFPEGLLIDRTGADSKVFRIGDRVFKEYGDHINIETLLAYKRVTDMALWSNAVTLYQEIHQGRITLGEEGFGMAFRITPILYVCTDGNSVGAVSEYIEGINVANYRGGFALSKSYSRKERKFLEVVRGQEYDCRRFLSTVRSEMSGISDELCSELGVEGININEPNAKIGLNLDQKMFTFTVTDLCAGLRDFKVHE